MKWKSSTCHELFSCLTDPSPLLPSLSFPLPVLVLCSELFTPQVIQFTPPPLSPFQPSLSSFSMSYDAQDAVAMRESGEANFKLLIYLCINWVLTPPSVSYLGRCPRQHDYRKILFTSFFLFFFVLLVALRHFVVSINATGVTTLNSFKGTNDVALDLFL